MLLNDGGSPPTGCYMNTDASRPPSQLLGPEHDTSDPVPIDLTYVICTSPRSGSNLLCDRLTSTGVLGTPTEYLELNVAGNYLARRWGASNLAEYVDAIRRHRVGVNGVLANKIHWRQLGILAKRIGAQPKDGQLAIEHHIATMDLIFPDATLVYLRRGDFVSQSVSLFKAFATGQWSSYMEARGTVPDYDFDQLLGHYRALVWEEASWNRFFATAGIEPLRLEYSDVTNDPQNVVESVARHVGVNEPVPVLGTPEIRRQRSDWNTTTKERFVDELSRRGASATDPESVLLLAS